jgi:hypothetical protein
VHRTALAALAGIAVIFAASLVLVDRLTSTHTTRGPFTHGAPVETENRQAPPSVPMAAAPILPPAGAEPAPLPAPGPVELTAAVSSRLAAAASQVDLGGQLEALRARVASRCGALALRQADDPANPARGLEGEAVLLLDLHVANGKARVTGSKVLSQGTMRPALTACAQYALRNQVLLAASSPDEGLTIPVVVSMPNGSP